MHKYLSMMYDVIAKNIALRSSQSDLLLGLCRVLELYFSCGTRKLPGKFDAVDQLKQAIVLKWLLIATFKSNNNNLRLIMVKTNRPTLHTVYNIQQSAAQGSNDTTHRLPHRTAATTRARIHRYCLKI